jgi:glutamine synthetase
MDTTALIHRAEEAGVRQVRFLFCDNAGIIRGKSAGRGSLRDRLHSGIGLTKAIQAMNSFDQLQRVEGLSTVGEVRLLPDPRTFRIVPYAPHTAALLCDLVEPDGAPWEACPRTFLRRIVEQAHGDFGLTFQVAFEPEWVLARRTQDGAYMAIDDSLGFSSIGMTTPATVIDEIIGALEAQNIRVEQYHPEMGHGQQELSIQPASALEAADNHLIYRDTVRSIAWNQGMIASFAPKPFASQPGNGCHIHLSAWAGDRGEMSLFYDPDDKYGLSQLGYFFIGGILDHLPALVALTCPTVNSYRRLKPQAWATAYGCYGPDNREAAVRIVSGLRGREGATINLEFRASDGTCNPYLALGALLAAGLDGVRRSLHPGEDRLLLVDPASLSAEERESRNIQRLPENLWSAIGALEQDKLLTEALGPLLTRAFTAIKRSEADHYATRTEFYEVDQHFYKY